MGAMEICELICWEYSLHKGTVSEDNLDIAPRTGVKGIGGGGLRMLILLKDDGYAVLITVGIVICLMLVKCSASNSRLISGFVFFNKYKLQKLWRSASASEFSWVVCYSLSI